MSNWIKEKMSKWMNGQKERAVLKKKSREKEIKDSALTERLKQYFKTKESKRFRVRKDGSFIRGPDPCPTPCKQLAAYHKKIAYKIGL